MAFDVTETQLNTLLASYESLTSVWVDSGLSRPPLDFQPGNLLCWPERPGSARFGQERTVELFNSPLADTNENQKTSAVVIRAGVTSGC